ncbi:hypothetical protein PMAYCL1PPCAC_28022, partial [Pristionchus mayeri]
QANSVTARLAGFDNALDNNKDGCPYAYKTPDGPQFPGISFLVPPQLLSLVISKGNAIQLQTDTPLSDIIIVPAMGFIASPGWNGCTKPNNGGFQSFRSRNDLNTQTYFMIDGDK